MITLVIDHKKPKVGSSFNAYLDIVYGVPQGPIFEPLLFNVNLCDLLFDMNLFDLFLKDYSSDFANFADDTTPYKYGPTLNEFMNNLEISTEKMFEWFSFSNLEVNASRCHLLPSLYQLVPVNIEGSITESSKCKNLLGIYMDSKFSFEYHRNRICRKASQELHALSMISKYISDFIYSYLS